MLRYTYAMPLVKQGWYAILLWLSTIWFMMLENANDTNEDANTKHLAELSADLLLSCYHFTSTIPAALLFHQMHARQRRRCHRKRRPAPSLFKQRLVWDTFCSRHSARSDFARHIRMLHDSFNKLISAIQKDLEVDREMAKLWGGAILPEICQYVCLRYLAGGSYSDIKYFTGISSASFYRVLWKTIRAINQSTSETLSIKFPATPAEARDAALAFQSISQGGCIWNCIAAVDGYHLQIQTPSKAEAKNVKSFLSGHYQTYGVNIQAACDSNSHFSFIWIAGPGVMGDREALTQVSLGCLVEQLPGMYCVIGDCAYTPTEHLVPIFRGANASLQRNENFNFFASQLRIRIEMAFGLMVKKWGIHARPLTIKLKNIKRLVVAIAKLHNFCINERLLSNCARQSQPQRDEQMMFTPTNVAFNRHEAHVERWISNGAIWWNRGRIRKCMVKQPRQNGKGDWSIKAQSSWGVKSTATAKGTYW